MTITDHDISKIALFIPCKESQGVEEMSQLYIQHVFPYYGLPDWVISDWDLHITSQWFIDICSKLEIIKNISTAYHPQTDGQSECTNQTLEAFLHIYYNHRQDNWAQYLPLAQFTINSRSSMIMKHSSFKVLMGFLPKGHQVFCQS
jgi:transposase InsO family protein